MKPIWKRAMTLCTRFAVASTLVAVTVIPVRAQIPLTRDQVARRTDALRAALDKHPEIPRAGVADAEVYWKAASWALRFDSALSDADLGLLDRLLERGQERLAALKEGRARWEWKRGRIVRAYVSDVDGSVQPYGLVVPRGYDPARPIRLDVVLHGSTRPAGMSEARFMAGFEEGDSGGSAPDAEDANYIELHPLGRVENCYRWAGETDVFEAIESVCRRYNIDRNRIVLRGMSMGASGTWHLGLKHPDYFVALGPYCGYVDTHRFSETPGMNFVKVGPLPDVQEDGLHMLDSVDYAANASAVPVVAAIGEKDPFFQAHVIMGEAFRKEGLKFVNLISPGTAHVQDPPTWTEQMRRIGLHAAKGLDHHPSHVRFVTWTLKYNRCHWVEILQLERHYQRAEVDVTAKPDGAIHVSNVRNVTLLALYPPRSASIVEVAGSRIRLPEGCGPDVAVVLKRRNGRWQVAGRRSATALAPKLLGKWHNVQGPIDDAFTRRFLCVRPTGKPWSPRITAWAEANLRRFSYEWARYFRGDLPVKDDTAVTDEEKRTCNLILFGDPGSNTLIRESLSRLPIRWSEEMVVMGTLRGSAADSAPSCIAPSPFAAGHYVVINSGHTFHEAELNRLNYLLFPRLGDWALWRIGPDHMPVDSSSQLPEELVGAGYLDERWRFPSSGGNDKHQ